MKRSTKYQSLIISPLTIPSYPASWCFSLGEEKKRKKEREYRGKERETLDLASFLHVGHKPKPSLLIGFREKFLFFGGVLFSAFRWKKRLAFRTTTISFQLSDQHQQSPWPREQDPVLTCHLWEMRDHKEGVFLLLLLFALSQMRWNVSIFHWQRSW